MKYKEALQIGAADGTIQCTYAIIYADPEGKKPLFSLQRKNFCRSCKANAFGNNDLMNYLDRINYGNYSWGALPPGADYEDFVATYTGYGREGLIGWDTKNKIEPGLATGYVIFDFPLVFAEEWHGEKFVPVTLTYDAIAYLRRTLTWAYPQKYFYLIDREGIDENGNKGVVLKEYYKYIPEQEKKEWSEKDSDRYVFVETYDISPRYKTLRDKVFNDSSVYYVKPAAFNWNAVDTSHMNNEGSPFRVFLERAEEGLRNAKKEYEQARNMLILAGGAALL